MPSTNWSDLNNLQLGRYAEYYAKMEFASYGFEVYTSEVDDHGIDFVIKKGKSATYYEIQVKSLLRSNYVYMQKTKWNIENPHAYLTLLLFKDGMLPETYLIPATAWKFPNDLLCYKKYDGLKSKPEYGINISKKNMPLLEQYKFEEVITSLL